MQFTSSWDDGHPLDLRLAELLNRHGFKGTFYVPLNNDRFSLPVLSAAGLRELDTVCEIGSHTLDHCYLTEVNTDTARQQIHDGRTALEGIVGHAVRGFCYPGGKYRQEHRALVESEGFAHARTTVNLEFDGAFEDFERPTTLQFYPHSRAVYMRNWMRYGRWRKRLPMALKALESSDFLSLMKASLLYAQERDGVFHLWGHSWELESFRGWGLLDEFLAFAADHVPPQERVTNAGVKATSVVLN
ncbi:polysaccharide deacetylase family protein [Methylibium sp.]|uniref:polysaccharide deacetylase family protein n=1 Tax=Methylibium sp. TaxID=2067992 RepID=UPI003D096726